LDYKAKLSEIFQLTKQQQYIDAVTELLNVMIEENKIRNDVNKNIEELMRKQQKQEVLKMTKKYVEEQLNTGKGGLKARKLERVKNNFKDLNPPALIKEVFDEEFERLEGTDSNSSDYNVALN
jgi:ATP-dependent Lon protease